MQGQTVCKMHGGKSPQALRKAEERMRDLVHPAIASLQRQIAADEFAAAKYVLDWAGFRPAVQTDAEINLPVRVTLAFDRADELEVPHGPIFDLPEHANGHS
jgi:hypothetical protein